MQVTNIFSQKTNSKLHSRRITVGCAALFISDMISVRQMFFSDPSFFTGGFARSIKALLPRSVLSAHLPQRELFPFHAPVPSQWFFHSQR